ncbi:OLC1v1035503C1 [Oldenlandia corymbosa var. corymbosa]|uniref:non-specific serine/threonine protein kinase n=1 Tax=Oldenlandia corymbosa var. corymbosa TaxID=529605 RepID=A0AAV1CTU4_OLDCO|nr:OLC1v1035503C1 [Oldenlandia corymbosa var. corymbosa]
MKSLIFPISYMFLGFLSTCLGRTAITNITTDQIALLAIKNHIITSDPHHQILFRNWSLNENPSASSVCNWSGVACGSRHHRVTALNISYMGLSSTIPPQLGNLSFLVSLDISGNDFHGEIPEELSRLRRLKVLNFLINNLSGQIPSWIGSLHELRYLGLMNNSFTGIIPPSISNLSNLEQLTLAGNSLQGNIPKGIGNLVNLRELDLEENRISGPIPHEIFNISTLEVFALTNNKLSGNLPMSMCNRLKNLYWLNLSWNRLNGNIPSNLSQCSELQMLSLSVNQFGGYIPKEIGSLNALQQLYLNSNNLEGVIPEEFGDLSNLAMLTLDNNSLSGSIPIRIFNISTINMISLPLNNLSGNLPSHICGKLFNLEYLYLQSNNLHGVVPESISNCSNLIEVDLSENKFVGGIPNTLGNLRLLEWLDLGSNYLTSNSQPLKLEFMDSLTNCKFLRMLSVGDNLLDGYLPKSVGNLSSFLENFYVEINRIKGKIPEEMGNLSRLTMLSLEKNRLTGSIPETFKGLQKLQELYANDNELDRAMFEKLCELPKLALIYLSGNKILEPIPECLGNVTSLRYLHLGSNKINSIIPPNLLNLKDLLELNLSRNLLSGSLPPEVGNLKASVRLDFSNNDLSLGIPNTIGGLQNLEYLSLAFNGLQGTIPESMGKMIGLNLLDLSHNNLSGTIPMTLEKLSYLVYFNVSYNNLSGEIPLDGPFQKLTSESFMSNKALCGAQRFHVPPCQRTSPHKTRGHRMMKVLFVLLGLAFVVGVIAFVCVYIRFVRKGKVLRMSDSGLLASKERFSYYQLARATDGFHERNLLGKGSFGSVYKGVIDEGRVVAIKVFNLEIQGAFKSFDTECEVLRNLRHINLTKVISNCSAPDFKALILEFMPNGSLEKWLYSHEYFLNIIQRLDIMIDVSVAVEYLHNGYLTPVVHCDLKPSNVLLDQDMVAHVSDFGISKFMSHEDSITYTQTIATFGYIAPEYGLEGLISPKCDVYSFGIMLMEVFTGKKPNDDAFDGKFNLRTWVNDSMSCGFAAVVDTNILSADEVNFTQKMQCIYSIMELALNCTHDSPRERSNIKDVVVALKKIKLQILMHHP